MRIVQRSSHRVQVSQQPQGDFSGICVGLGLDSESGFNSIHSSVSWLVLIEHSHGWLNRRAKQSTLPHVDSIREVLVAISRGLHDSETWTCNSCGRGRIEMHPDQQSASQTRTPNWPTDVRSTAVARALERLQPHDNSACPPLDSTLSSDAPRPPRETTRHCA